LPECVRPHLAPSHCCYVAHLLEDATAVVLQAQFNATVRAGSGVSGWFQKLLGFGEKTLDGVMRVQARPVWDSQSRVLSFDALEANDSVDSIMQERLSQYGGQWQANTAKIQVNDLVALDKGMQLDAQLNADWVIRFSSDQWPTDFSGLVR